MKSIAHLSRREALRRFALSLSAAFVSKGVVFDSVRLFPSLPSSAGDDFEIVLGPRATLHRGPIINTVTVDAIGRRKRDGVEWWAEYSFRVDHNLIVPPELVEEAERLVLARLREKFAR